MKEAMAVTFGAVERVYNLINKNKCMKNALFVVYARDG